MKRRPFSLNVSTQGFSVAVSARLILLILSSCKNVLFRPDLEPVYHDLRKEFSAQVAEFAAKLSPPALNKRFDKKIILGAKITFYYEDED